MVTLVTGASGFVGSALVRALLDQGKTLRVLVRAAGERSNLRDLGVEVVEGDVTDPSSLTRAVAGCEVVFHAAADYRLWAREVDDLYQTNVTGTLNVLTAAAEAGVERIVYTSSAIVFAANDFAARHSNSPAHESSAAMFDMMIGHYARSKFIADEQVRQRTVSDGWPVVIVNPATTVGPRDVRPTATGRLVVDAARGRIPAFVDCAINVVHVDDVAAGHLLALEHGVVGERYILGGDDLTLERVLEQISTLCGYPAPRIKLPAVAMLPFALGAQQWCKWRGQGEPLISVEALRLARRDMRFSSARAQRELGYQARPAAQAIEAAVLWFRAQGLC